MAERFWTPPAYVLDAEPREGESRSEWKTRTFAALYGNPEMLSLEELLSGRDRNE